jgi:hypothetical protein
VKRAWMILAGLVVLLLAGPAEAQIESSVLLSAGVPGGKVLSETNISARVQGDLVVTFHGDVAAGCATQGVCPYSGTIVVRPRSGGVGVVTYRRHGRVGHYVFVAVGSPENGPATTARVTRSVAGFAAGGCADAQSLFFSDVSSSSVRGGSVTIHLLGPGGSLLQTRCAGPTDGDLSGASPVTKIRLTRLLRGRTVLDLSGSTPFASHGFAGTIDSTLRLELGRPSSQSPNVNFPPGTKTQRVRTVIEQLSLVGVRGGITATVHGAGNPIVCGLLDSCGLSETLSLTGPVRGASGQLIAIGPARRPYADFLTALGLSRAGRARGIAVSGTVDWAQPVRAEMSQAGSLCTDTAASGGVAIQLGLGGVSGGFAQTWRTRCPGPSLGDKQPILSGPLDRSALDRRQFRLQVGGSGTSSDDGYVIRAHGHLSLVLRRGRITQQVSAEPTD